MGAFNTQSYKKFTYMLRRLLAFLLLGATLGLQGLRAQSVGVVMSGGGAKGLYHIGVLEALEENGIPIDYVAGTSMGSIVAALYAAGYSPDELKQIVASGVVKEWVSGRIDPLCMPYYRQIGRIPSFLNLRVNFDQAEGKRLQVPKNLLSSTPIDMALLELLAPATAAAGGDFDNLMVPFLCVASDLNAREGVVMRDGDLGEAVRSSMSIPLVFKPMKIDSMILYDGGIYDNFPWRPMDECFRPGFIIGSVCTKGNTPPSENNDLMEQALVLSMHDSDYSLPEGRSLMIRRAVPVGMLEFDAAVAIIQMGYDDTMELMPALLEQISERRDSSYFAKRRAAFRAKCPPLQFDEYVISGLNDKQREYVRDFAKFDPKESDEQRVMEFPELKDKLYGILASGDFVMDFPKAIYNPATEHYAFAARLETKPSFKMMIGGNLSSTAFNQAYIGISYETIGRVAHTVGADLYLGPLYTWGAFGGRADFYMGKPVYLDYALNFDVKNLRHGSFGNVTAVDNTMQVKNSEAFASLAAGMPLSRRSLIELRANGGLINFRYDSDIPLADDTDHSRFSYFGLKLKMERNTLDKPLYPRRGSHLILSGIYITGRDKYRPFDLTRFVAAKSRQWVGARLSWDRYFDLPEIKWFSFGIDLDALITNQPRFLTETASVMAMPVYEPVAQSKMIFMPDFHARRFIAGGLMPTFDLLPNFFFRTGFYAMWRDHRDWGPGVKSGLANDETLHYIVEASFVYHTSIGPVSLSLTKYDLGNWNNMYLTFNFGYALFAQRGTFY